MDAHDGAGAVQSAHSDKGCADRAETPGAGPRDLEEEPRWNMAEAGTDTRD